jgi:hypothetical protein
MQFVSAASRVAVLAGLISFTGVPARAIPDFTLDVSQNNGAPVSLDETDFNCTTATHCEISHIIIGDLEFGEVGNPAPGLSIDLYEDPEMVTAFGVKNLNANTQRFTLVFTGTVASIPGGGTLTGGSNAWDFGDNNGDGVTLNAPAGSSLYTALIDNLVHDTLFDAPLATFSHPIGGTAGPESFGNPIPSQAGPASLNSSIGIKYDFEITGGDDASSTTGRFVVKPVPEPVTAALVALGIVGLAVVGRRRR